MVAVDESHCVSQWGQDFRPSYLNINKFISMLPNRPIIGAFTATATDEVKKDIINILQLEDPAVVTTGFDRPNLFFSVLRPAKKDNRLIELIKERRDKSGIIYCSTRKKVESVCDLLIKNGFPATRYHAGLSDEERVKNQDDFVYDRKPVMVATNAFGMGIDKSNVSYVIHYNMPKNIESYYQEAEQDVTVRRQIVFCFTEQEMCRPVDTLSKTPSRIRSLHLSRMRCSRRGRKNV